LPEQARHFNAVACESCHVPRLEMGARQSIDKTVLQTDGSPLISYRGIDDSNLADLSMAYITGYQPLLRVGKSALGKNQVQPYNLVTEWFWTDGDSHTPVDAAQLRAAWLVDGSYPADIMETFDTDRNRQLDRQELRLDNNIKLMLITERLRGAGVRNPRVHGEVRAYHIHHNIRHGTRVNRDCNVCHADKVDTLPAFELAPHVPGMVKPLLLQDTTAIVLDGSWETRPDGSLQFAPARSAAKSWQAQENTIRSEP
jgi:hypothetical protein